MKNFTCGENLLNEAKQIINEVSSAYENNSWNLTVRRAQEVVELSLKALLKIMGIEYPKNHDVGEIFENALKKRGIKEEPGKIAEIVKISAQLSEVRAPAFYFDKEYNQEEAEEAKESAAKVLEFAEGLVEKLRRNK